MEESQIKQIIEQQPLHGSALLDPRCKILLLVCIGFVSYFLAGEVVSLALMLVYGLFIAVGNGGKWALKMIVVYIIVAYLNALLRYVQVPVLSVIMSVFGVTLLKLIPIVMMGLWILRTTYMDDLMVALQRMRLPQAVTIPLVVMFRYIPTLRIEYRQIRSTMDIRGISDTFLHLTDVGREVAERTYEKHCFFTRLLVDAGVEPKTAEQDACRMEHAISDDSFQKIKSGLKDK